MAIVVEVKGLAEYHEFPALTAFGRIKATRVIDGKTETDVRMHRQLDDSFRAGNACVPVRPGLDC